MNKKIIRFFGAVGLATALAGVMSGTARAVDGVVLINQVRALAGNVTPGDAPGFPVTISRAGSYRLASDLTVAGANVDGIYINTNDVTLDLNGFTIFGTGTGTGSGITSPGLTGDITVINGTVRDMGADGIRVDAAIRVENVTSLANGGDGISVTSGSIVTGCVAANNDGNGIRVGVTSVVIGNVAVVNGMVGIKEVVAYMPPDIPGGGTLVKNNTASRNTGLGLKLGSSSGYGNNVIEENNGGNANPQVAGGIEIATNICGGDTICP